MAQSDTTDDFRPTAESNDEMAALIRETGKGTTLTVTLDDGREFTGPVMRGMFMRTLGLLTQDGKALTIHVTVRNRRVFARGDAVEGEHEVTTLEVEGGSDEGVSEDGR